jgi:nucleoside 2-deoxyribosyltransferase
MIKIYFAGSIRGGRNDRGLYNQIIQYLQQFGEVLTEHVGDGGLTPMGEAGMSDEDIYNRDMDWLTSADVVVAEVSTPSLGVGFEIASAIRWRKKVLCLFRIQEDRKLSAMIAGCPEVTVTEYRTMEDIKTCISHFLDDV